MKILIAGGSGFIGGYLERFLSKSHQVVILTRLSSYKHNNVTVINWDGKKLVTQQEFDAIINLCGVGIASKRWSRKNRQVLLNSRIEPTQAIVDFIRNYSGANKPRLINASAIGYYPSSPFRQDENSHHEQTSFAYQLVSQWEKNALAASNYGIAVTCLRFGIVLGKGGGLIAKLLPSYQRGFGAVMGDPNAYLSWVHIDDLCRAVSFILSLEQPCPVYNITAPNACTQLEFSKTLAKLCQRPCFLRLPPFLVKRIFGQMGKELLLANQKIYPQQLIKERFDFTYSTIDRALNSIFAENKMSCTHTDLG